MEQKKFAMSVDEAAECTGIGKNTIRQLISWKKLPVLRVGRKILIRTESLEDLLKNNMGKDLRIKEEVTPVE